MDEEGGGGGGGHTLRHRFMPFVIPPEVFIYFSFLTSAAVCVRKCWSAIVAMNINQ